jgi:hypothetical protein
MTGSPKPDFHHLRIEFGSYAQVFEANNPTNTNKARTTGAIALHPTGNTQGGFYFMSLVTGRRLSRHQFDELPMPDGVIELVEDMASAENQPIMEAGAPIFEWTPGIVIQDNNDPPIINDNPGAQAQINDIAVAPADPDDADEGPAPVPDDDDSSQNPENEESDADNRSDSQDNDDDSDADDSGSEYDPDNDDDQDSDDSPSDAEQERIELDDGFTPVPPKGGHNLRKNRTRNYNHRLDHSMDASTNPQSYETKKGQQGGATLLQKSSVKAKIVAKKRAPKGPKATNREAKHTRRDMTPPQKAQEKSDNLLSDAIDELNDGGSSFLTRFHHDTNVCKSRH